jgi:hypothetical protein
MTPSQFEQWLSALKHARSLRFDTQVAKLLGVSLQTMLAFRRKGLRPDEIKWDQRTWLACLALTAGLDVIEHAKENAK